MKLKKATKKVTTPKKPDETKVFDVTSPGKTVADTSGKPVLVANRTVVRDPMVTPITEQTEASGEITTEEAKSPTPGKMRIEPLHADAESEEKPAETDGEAGETEKTADDTPAEDRKPEEAPLAENKDDDEEEDEFGELPEAAKKTAAKEAAAVDEADAKRQAAAEEAIASRQYFVPINAVKKRRSARTIALIIVVVVLGLGFLAGLDTGAIDIGISAPTDFLPD